MLERRTKCLKVGFMNLENGLVVYISFAIPCIADSFETVFKPRGQLIQRDLTERTLLYFERIGRRCSLCAVNRCGHDCRDDKQECASQMFHVLTPNLLL